MPLEKCLHALIFSTEAAALPLPQRRQLKSSTKICTYIHTPPPYSQKNPYANHLGDVQSMSMDWLRTALLFRKPRRSAARFSHWKFKNNNKNNKTGAELFSSAVCGERCESPPGPNIRCIEGETDTRSLLSSLKDFTSKQPVKGMPLTPSQSCVFDTRTHRPSHLSSPFSHAYSF